MKLQIDMPGATCESCQGKLQLSVVTQRVRVAALQVDCTACGWHEDLLDKGGEALDAGKQRVKAASSEIARTLVKLKDTLPEDREAWGEVVRNPGHPFTATLLSMVALLLMEMSGFGVFMVVTWILGNLILNPVGWVLVPLIVGIGFLYRDRFKRSKLDELKLRLDELEQKRTDGAWTEEEYRAERAETLHGFFR